MSPADPEYSRVYRLVVSHAVTGEAVGIEHYALMIPIARSLEERIDLLEDAYHERNHLLAMRDVAARIGVRVETDIDDAYWGRVRAAFQERVDARDLEGCYVIQDIVLETFAVTLYEAILPGLEPWVARRIELILTDERKHLDQGVEALARAASHSSPRLKERVEFANERVARVLSEWIRPEDCAPICGVCERVSGACAKEDLKRIEVDMARVQSAFASHYGRALRDAGFLPAEVTRWLARLPS